MRPHDRRGAARRLAPLTLLLLSLIIPSINCDLQPQADSSTTTTTSPTTTTTTQFAITQASPAGNAQPQAAAVASNMQTSATLAGEQTNQTSTLSDSMTTLSVELPSTTTTTTSLTTAQTSTPQATTTADASTPITTTQSSRIAPSNNQFALISDQESVSPASDADSSGSIAESTISSLMVASSTVEPSSNNSLSGSPHRQGRSSQSTPSQPGYSAPLSSRLSAYSPATMLAEGSRLGSDPSVNNNPFASNSNPQQVIAATTTTTTTTPAPKPVTDPIIVCYLGSWSVYRPGVSKFTPENINPFLCTHVIYAFAGLSSKLELKPFDSYNDITQGGYRKFTSLKEHNKQLKTLIAVGGWNEGSSRFSRLVASTELRANFVQSAIRFLREHKFDGLDLDWEYPAFRDGSSLSDREKYALLIKELRTAFDKDKELHPSASKLLLSVAVPAGQDNIDNGFDVATISDNVDFMNVLTYDYYTAFDKQANHHAPLSLRPNQNVDAASKRLTVDWTVNYYLSLGANPAKLIVGVPTYGRSYTLAKSLDEPNNRVATTSGDPELEATDKLGLGAQADGPGEEGGATREKGYLAYYEICQRTDQDGWSKEQFASQAQGPIAFKGNQWVSYDDLQSVIMKTHYVIKRGLGGVMVWTLDNDDFRASCPSSKGQESPLISAIRDTLIKTIIGQQQAAETLSQKPTVVAASRAFSKQHSTTTTTTTTSTTTSTTTPAPPTNSPAPDEDSSSRNQNELAASSSDESASPSSGLLRNLATGKAAVVPTTPEPGAAFTCKDEGFFANPKDCKKYFWCLDSGPANLGVVAHAFTCPSGLVFNPQTDGCDYAEKVGCKSARKSTTTTSTTTTTTSTSTTTTPKPRLASNNYEARQQQQQAASSDRSRLVVVKKNNRKSSSTTTSTTSTTTTTTTTTTPAPLQASSTISSSSSQPDLAVTNDINELVASMLQNPQFAQVISDQLNKQAAAVNSNSNVETNSNNNNNNNNNDVGQPAGEQDSGSSSQPPSLINLDSNGPHESPFGNTDSLTANMSSKQAQELLQLLNIIQSLGGVDKIAPYLAQQLASKQNAAAAVAAGSDQVLPASDANDNSTPTNDQFVFNYQNNAASESQPGGSQQAPNQQQAGISPSDQSLSAEVMHNIAQLESLFAYNQPGRQLTNSLTSNNNNNKQLNQKQHQFVNPTSQQQFTLNDAKVMLGGAQQQQPALDTTTGAMIRVKVPDQHHHHHHHHHHHQNQQQQQATRGGNQHRSGVRQQQQQAVLQQHQQPPLSRGPPTKLADYNNLLPYLEGDVRQPIARLQPAVAGTIPMATISSQQQQMSQSRRQPQSSVRVNFAPAASSVLSSDSIEALAEEAQSDGHLATGGQQPRQQSRNRPQSASVSQASLVRQQQQSQLQPQVQQQPRSRRPPNREHRNQRLNTQDFPLPSVNSKLLNNQQQTKPKQAKQAKQQKSKKPQQQLHDTNARSLVLLSEGPPISSETTSNNNNNNNNDNLLPFGNGMSLSELSESLSDSALEERLRLLESGLFPPNSGVSEAGNSQAEPASTSGNLDIGSQPALSSFRSYQSSSPHATSPTTTATLTSSSEPSDLPALIASPSSPLSPQNALSTATTLADLFAASMAASGTSNIRELNLENENNNDQDDALTSTQRSSSSPSSSAASTTTATSMMTTTTQENPASSSSQSIQENQPLSQPQSQSSQLLPNSSLQDPGASYDLESGLLVCNRRGVFAHPKSCGQFIVCAPQSRSQRSLRPFEHHCPAEHIFHDSWGRCRPKSLQSDLTKLCQASQL